MNPPQSNSTPPPVCVLACSGCSAAGELADHTARRLQKLGAAKMSCLAGVGGRVSSIMATVQNAPGILMIDGCPLECGAHVLRGAGFTGFKQIKLHELGIRKNDSAAVDESTVARLADDALRVLRGEGPDQA
ncbi:MAG: putative zinc-binding protein [Verrucomicrobiota bacterium]